MIPKTDFIEHTETAKHLEQLICTKDRTDTNAFLKCYLYEDEAKLVLIDLLTNEQYVFLFNEYSLDDLLNCLDYKVSKEYLEMLEMHYN